MKVSGIYALINKVNGKVYVGQSVDIAQRFADHKYKINRNYHISNAIKKYGWNNFYKIVLEYINVSELQNEEIKSTLTKREDFWINYIGEIGYIKYNKRSAADSNLGLKMSLETRQKISKAHMGNSYAKGYKHSAETRARVSKACTGRIKSDATRAKLSASLTGRKFSPEQIENMRKAQTGKKMSEESRKKMSAKLIGNTHTLGHKLSKEHKNKISNALMGNKHTLGYKHTAETKAKMSKARLGNQYAKGFKHSEETKKKKQEAMLRKKLLDIKKVEI